jgi:hypothetical protein
MLPIAALPEIRRVAHGRLKLLADSGFRRAADIINALALGAEFNLTGRAALFAIVAGSEEGVVHAVSLLKAEVGADRGLHGWGEAGGVGREPVCEATVRQLKPCFIGQTPVQIELLWNPVYRDAYHRPTRELDEVRPDWDEQPIAPEAPFDVLARVCNAMMIQVASGERLSLWQPSPLIPPTVTVTARRRLPW